MWKILTSVREVLKIGLKWTVEIGSKIKIWGDPWLPTCKIFKVQSPISTLGQETKVQELFNECGNDWNTSLVNELLWPKEATAILSIPISQR